MVILSVIVSTRNRGEYLKDTLVSIKNQEFPEEQYEILLIDNGSTDNTKEIVKTLNDSGGKKIAYFYEEKPGLHHARHRGAKESKGEILVYTDDDIIAERRWLCEVLNSFQKEEIALVGGKILPQWEAPVPDWIDLFWETGDEGRYLVALSLLDLGDKPKIIPPRYVWGCNFALRKVILYECGGFHPDALPEELICYRGDGESGLTESVFRRGYKIFYNPLAVVYHRIPPERMTIEYFCKRAFNQGISDSYTAIRNRLLSGNKRLPKKKEGFAAAGIKMVISRFKEIISQRNIRQMQNRVSEYAVIKDLVEKSWRKGVKYHRLCLRRKKELLSYVMKKDYFNL